MKETSFVEYRRVNLTWTVVKQVPTAPRSETCCSTFTSIIAEGDVSITRNGTDH